MSGAAKSGWIVDEPMDGRGLPVVEFVDWRAWDQEMRTKEESVSVWKRLWVVMLLCEMWRLWIAVMTCYDGILSVNKVLLMARSSPH